ncbi:hypothetical protein Tco_0285241 [Tanacetum coccineum]
MNNNKTQTDDDDDDDEMMMVMTVVVSVGWQRGGGEWVVVVERRVATRRGGDRVDRVTGNNFGLGRKIRRKSFRWPEVMAAAREARRKIGRERNETVYKEWEDRMEMAVTTASSLEAKQESEAQTRFEAAEAQTWKWGGQHETKGIDGILYQIV